MVVQFDRKGRQAQTGTYLSIIAASMMSAEMNVAIFKDFVQALSTLEGLMRASMRGSTVVEGSSNCSSRQFCQQ